MRNWHTEKRSLLLMKMKMEMEMEIKMKMKEIVKQAYSRTDDDA